MVARQRQHKLVTYSELHDFLRQIMPEHCNANGRLLIPEASKALNIHPVTLYKAQKSGKVSKVTAKLMVLSSQGRITEDSIKKFVA